MFPMQRSDFRYTALFCEENVWWLAHELAARGIPLGHLHVLLISNRWESVVLREQRAAPPGRPMAWDYHVVLAFAADDADWILDLDTRLAFPCVAATYFDMTFPPQQQLPERYRARVRTIPAAAYLEHFHSDRAHMRGRIAAGAFPAWPIITPRDGVAPLTLASCRDIDRPLGPEDRVQTLEETRAAWSRTPVAGAD